MANLHENKLHGQPAFPFTVYRGRLPDYIRSYPLHWHEEMEVIYITEGRGLITIQAERYQVLPGDILLIPPQCVHSIEQLGSESMEYFNILFRLSMLSGDGAFEKYTLPLYSSGAVPFRLPEGHELNRKLLPHIRQLIENRRQVDSDYALMIHSHLYALLYHIVHNSQASAPESIHLRTNYDRLKVVLEHLRLHYPESISIHQAAAMCGFSDSHFMKLFRELTGVSFAQYVKLLRLEAAADLLSSTHQRIGEIAESVGFHNLSYFTRAFETRYGMSPTAYQKQRKK